MRLESSVQFLVVAASPTEKEELLNMHKHCVV